MPEERNKQITNIFNDPIDLESNTVFYDVERRLPVITSEEHTRGGKLWSIAPPEDPIWFNEKRDWETVKKYCHLRPYLPVGGWDYKKDLEFQVNDFDYVFLNRRKAQYANEEGSLCVRLFGGTLDKYSICVVIPVDMGSSQKAFWPRFSIELPVSWTASDYQMFYDELNDQATKQIRNYVEYRRNLNKAVRMEQEILELDYLQNAVNKRTLLRGFDIDYGQPWEPIESFSYRPFMVLYVCSPTIVRKIRELVEEAYSGRMYKNGGQGKPWLSEHLLEGGAPRHRYGSRKEGLRAFNILDFKYIFSIEHNFGGEEMVKILGGRYFPVDIKSKTSICQLEVICSHYNVMGLAGENPPRLVPKLVLCYDIEAIAPETREFPIPTRDKVCTVSFTLCWIIPGNADPIRAVGVNFQLGDAEIPMVQEVNDSSLFDKCGIKGSITHIVTLFFAKEKQMLKTMTSFKRMVQPDVETGYNINWFDEYFLVGRIESTEATGRRAWLGKCSLKPSVTIETTFRNRIMTKVTRFTNMPGIVSVDMLPALTNEDSTKKSKSFMLGAICTQELGITKLEMDPLLIGLYMLNKIGRKKIVQYCYRDAVLPLFLLIKFRILLSRVLACRGSGITMQEYGSRGQSIRVRLKVQREMFLWKKEHGDTEEARRNRRLNFPLNVNSSSGYEGATVVEPDSGFYDQPIHTLDFGSLYPSVMMCGNYDRATMIEKDVAENLKLEYEKNPDALNNDEAGGQVFVARTAIMDPDKTGDKGEYKPFHDPETMGMFVKPCVRVGLLATILQKGMQLRSWAKKERDKYPPGSDMYVYYDGFQLACKTENNSVYGWAALNDGLLASSVTAEGRRMIVFAAHLVTRKFNRANGETYDAIVIYGDTDSIFVKTAKADLVTLLERGLTMSKYVKQFLRAPHELAFEKMMWPFNLHKEKKRYEGKKYTIAIDNVTQRAMFENGRPVPYCQKTIMATGIQSNRRDCCRFVANCIVGFLDLRIMKEDREGAIEFLHQEIRKAYNHELPWDEYILSAKLSKPMEEYAIKSVPKHVIVARKMRERDPENYPRAGTRVPYLVYKSTNVCKVTQRLEHPIYVMENSYEIDIDYYVGHALRKAIYKIADNGMYTTQELNTLFNRNVYVTSRVSTAMGQGSVWRKLGIVVERKCAQCKKPCVLELCVECESKRDEIAKSVMQKKEELAKIQNDLDKTCIACVKEAFEGVEQVEIEDLVKGCKEFDCRIYWKRIKLESDKRVFGAGLGKLLKNDKVTDINLSKRSRDDKNPAELEPDNIEKRAKSTDL